MMFLYSFFYNLALSPLIVSYTVEILPFAIRAKGFTLFNFAISLSLILNQYVNPIAFKALGWKYFLVYVSWVFFELVFCYLFIIETKNRSLEETAVLFDGNDAVKTLAEKAALQAGILKQDNRRPEEISVAKPSSEKEGVQRIN
ncbi:unnamed protein product [Cyclocybe aegerita]|uniref:Major facilitator superfamily (MFS) profile domain-containing protein n=1 Tax=Cyclocybe aegerita TaxID=1973307 RepID=A0A8S0X693_CYCAE|nr:unnamed protein product [Cyclocybe aegerita]